MRTGAHLPERFKPQRRIISSDLPKAADKVDTSQSLNAWSTPGMLTWAGPFRVAGTIRGGGQAPGTNDCNFQGYSTYSDCDLIGTGACRRSGRWAPPTARTPRRWGGILRRPDQGLFWCRARAGPQPDGSRPARRDHGHHVPGAVRIDRAGLADRFRGILLRVGTEAVRDLQEQGLVVVDARSRSLSMGWYFVRAVAMVFDRYRGPIATAPEVHHLTRRIARACQRRLRFRLSSWGWPEVALHRNVRCCLRRKRENWARGQAPVRCWCSRSVDWPAIRSLGRLPRSRCRLSVGQHGEFASGLDPLSPCGAGVGADAGGPGSSTHVGEQRRTQHLVPGTAGCRRAAGGLFVTGTLWAFMPCGCSCIRRCSSHRSAAVRSKVPWRWRCSPVRPVARPRAVAAGVAAVRQSPASEGPGTRVAGWPAGAGRFGVCGRTWPTALRCGAASLERSGQRYRLHVIGDVAVPFQLARDALPQRVGGGWLARRDEGRAAPSRNRAAIPWTPVRPHAPRACPSSQPARGPGRPRHGCTVGAPGQQAGADAACRLVSREQDGSGADPSKRLEVVHHPATGRHAAGRDDHHRTVPAIRVALIRPGSDNCSAACVIARHGAALSRISSRCS